MAEDQNTRELLQALKHGAEILHNGAPVDYRPRFRGDREPWVFAEDGTRYQARQCQVYLPGKKR